MGRKRSMSTYVLTAIPTPVTTSIQNAASGSIGAVAPGEIISIFGTNLGPATPATTTVSAAGFFATTLCGNSGALR